MGDGPELEPRDSCEVGCVTRVERQRVRDRAGRDGRVIRARRRLAPRCAECRRHTAKGSRAISVERKYIKVGLGLLQVLLTGTALDFVLRYMRSHRKLSQSYRADHRFVGKLGWVGYLTEEEHRRGVQVSNASPAHPDNELRPGETRSVPP